MFNEKHNVVPGTVVIGAVASAIQEAKQKLDIERLNYKLEKLDNKEEKPSKTNGKRKTEPTSEDWDRLIKKTAMEVYGTPEKAERALHKSDTQFTILGMSGAGKTCYLLALYYLLSAGLDGFTLNATFDSDRSLLARQCEMLKNSSLSPDERFPVGTDQISKYAFSLNYGFKKIMTFDWFDYPGGLLDPKNSGTSDEYDQLMTAINKSSCLFICVDGSLLSGDDEAEKIHNVREKCSSVFNRFISNYLASNNVLPPTVFIITKYDECMTELIELERIIRQAFSPFFIDDQSDSGEKYATVIPVTLGQNIMDNDGHGKFEPEAVELPIYLGLLFAISKMKHQAEQDLDFHNELIKHNVNVLNKNNGKIFKNNQDVKLAKFRIYHLNDMNEESKKILETVSKANKVLIAELGKKLKNEFYVNGEQITFTQLVDKLNL